MRSIVFLAALAAQASRVLSAPSTACAQVGAALARNGTTDLAGSTKIDVDTAHACLTSVPLDTEGAASQLSGLKTLLNFHSDLVYLSKPPAGWLYNRVDLLASLEAMSANVYSGGYENEYALQLDIYNLMTSAYDFHLIYILDILNVFRWFRNAFLVSVSTDGSKLPNHVFHSSNVETWLNECAAFNPWDHDADANYNAAFFNVPATGNRQTGLGASFSQYLYRFPGSQTVLTFANGTSKTINSYATLTDGLDFTNVTHGKSFFNKFCSGPAPSSSAVASRLPSSTPFASLSIAPASSEPAIASVTFAASSAVTTNNIYTPLASSASLPPIPSFYPQPAVLAPDYSIASYFPEEQKDLAVATIPTFAPASGKYIFQNKFRTFLATAKALGKTRLILDLRANGGGSVANGFSLFKMLFPSKVPFGASNLAAWPLLDALGQVASEPDIHGLLSKASYEEDLTVTNDDYDWWEDFYGPVQHHGGDFTNVRRYNFSSPNNILGPPIYGYINDTNPQLQTFEWENVVVLSDGFCGSTCAVFAELLKTQAGIKFVTVGGRKQNGPMQAVGGSKGSNDQQLQTLVDLTQTTYEEADKEQRALFEPYLKDGLQVSAQQVLNRRSSLNPVGNVNFQNSLRKGDDTYTPLQFVYEASDCRFFYTAEMIFSQQLVWQQTYNLRWGNATCVPGSSNQPSATSGFDTSYINASPPDTAKNFFGADITWSYPGALKGGLSNSSSASPSSMPSSGAPSAPAPSATGSTGGAASIAGAGSGVVYLAAAVAGLLSF
ncbi:uncharacterized protein LTR77_005776 [Saxophila tyrrhenica]|uniref:CPAF-like PDZ domain-containing protein n=1 Tax=Saxophila tyrrhenica TaxID=1690608 RepID=A0AAV9P9V8_9PEZI|nr:hypothetical protein LTR77_005776 [Saxophila tyrrhenica]